MKAPGFAYACPTTLAEAVTLLATHAGGAKVLAGGQSLMPSLNMRLSHPGLLIDINRVDALATIQEAAEGLSIGALTRHVTLERSALIARHAPLLAKAAPHIAHAAIRNRGTIGGSLAFADPAAELPACAVALEARIVTEGPRGRRHISADDFFLGLFHTALELDELVISVEVSKARSEQSFVFTELARRSGDYAMIGLAGWLTRRGGRFAQTRLVYFGVGDRPIVAQSASRVLEGERDTPALRTAAAAAAIQDLDPVDDLQASAEMRRHLAKVLLERTLSENAA